MESKTSQITPQCTCNWLHNMAADPSTPIVFNPEMNEFDIHSGKSRYIIYYCPFCGGGAPPSLRDTFFSTVPSDEEQRLDALNERIKSIEAALAEFGPPDKERRTLTYKNLSETANVFVLVDNNEWRGIHHMPKQIKFKNPDSNAPQA